MELTKTKRMVTRAFTTRLIKTKRMVTRAFTTRLTKTKRMVTRAFTTRLTKQQRMVTKSIHKTTRKMILQTQMITKDKEVNEATNQNARIATAKRRNPNYGDQRSRSPRGLYNINSYLRKYAYHGKINGSIRLR